MLYDMSWPGLSMLSHGQVSPIPIPISFFLPRQGMPFPLMTLQLCVSRPGAIPQPTDSSASVVNNLIVHCIASRALIIGAYFIKARTTNFFANPFIDFVVIPALWSAGPPTTMKGHMHHFWNALIKRFQTNGAAVHNQNDLREWLIRILRR